MTAADVGWVALAFAVGSIPTGWWLSRRAAGVDPRSEGSGGTGATNVLRTVGRAPAAATLALDVLKGAGAVWVARRSGGDGVALAAAYAAVLGHVYPPWLRGRGGKGVATAWGGFLVLAPAPAAFVAAVFAGAVSWSRRVSVGSCLASVTFPAAAWAWGTGRGPVGLGILVALSIVFWHRSNLARLRRGLEPALGETASHGRDGE